MQTEIYITTAQTQADFENARQLFLEYANSLEVDLCFQNFQAELQAIDQQYNLPTGTLLLAFAGERAIGCVGVRQITPDSAELKRMYVQPEYRQHQIGRKLLTHALDAVQSLGYTSIRLDTLPSMTTAQHLYRTFGFNEITSYRMNPVEGVIYMEKRW
jgi:putative acetyltransferase